MSKIFVVGDIHGCYNTFKRLLQTHCKIRKEDTLYLLGDYLDRGPYSKEVIDYILDLMNEGWDVRPLIGNHELMLLESIDSISMLELWYSNGCISTLRSFNISHPRQFPEKYLNFFKSLKYYYLTDEFILVHGGLNFNLENPLDDLKSMVWERNNSADLSKTGGRRLIVGHTPKSLEQIKASVNSNIVHLDGGCVYYNKYPAVGYLVAYELTEKELFIQQNIELL